MNELDVIGNEMTLPYFKALSRALYRQTEDKKQSPP